MSNTLENPSITVDKDSNDRVRLTIWSADHTDMALRVLLEPGDALEFMGHLASAVASAATHAAQTIAIGDCATCANTRLVDVDLHGRTSRDRCPDCGPRYGRALSAPFARPRIGGGIA